MVYNSLYSNPSLHKNGQALSQGSNSNAGKMNKTWSKAQVGLNQKRGGDISMGWRFSYIQPLNFTKKAKCDHSYGSCTLWHKISISQSYWNQRFILQFGYAGAKTMRILENPKGGQNVSEDNTKRDFYSFLSDLLHWVFWKLVGLSAGISHYGYTSSLWTRLGLELVLGIDPGVRVFAPHYPTQKGRVLGQRCGTFQSQRQYWLIWSSTHDKDAKKSLWPWKIWR